MFQQRQPPLFFKQDLTQAFSSFPAIKVNGDGIESVSMVNIFFLEKLQWLRNMSLACQSPRNNKWISWIMSGPTQSGLSARSIGLYFSWAQYFPWEYKLFFRGINFCFPWPKCSLMYVLQILVFIFGRELKVRVDYANLRNKLNPIQVMV